MMLGRADVRLWSDCSPVQSSHPPPSRIGRRVAVGRCLLPELSSDTALLSLATAQSKHRGSEERDYGV